MLNRQHAIYYRQSGTSLMEVLMTVVILAFGLLGLAKLQSKIQLAELESYQRVQATLLAADISERINANRAQAANYVSTGTFGTGDSQPADCSTVAIGAPRDLCEWSHSLKGAAEKKSTSNVGAMIGARGCITEIQTADPTTGTCTPGIYQVTVAWQGLHPTIKPKDNCGENTYGNDDNMRRTISTQISVGLPSCSS